MKYPIFVLLCSEFAKIKLQTIVGCLKFISCENWALWIVNFVKPAEMLKTLSGNSGISDMDSFYFVYNLKYSKLHTILYMDTNIHFHEDLENVYSFLLKKGKFKNTIVLNFYHKSFKSTRETWKSEKDTNIWWSFRFVCLSIPDFWDSSSGLTISFLLNLVQNFHQSIGKLQ